MNYIIYLIKFLLRILKRIFFPNTARFIRLSPNHEGNIWFYDQKNKKTLKIKSRNYIDSVTADQIYSFNDYDLSFLARYQDIIKKYNNIIEANKIPLIIDCGANIGLSAKFFSEEFPKSKIISIEPELKNIELAKVNCEKNHNIEFIQAAIGSTTGNVRINNIDDDPNSFKVSRAMSSNDDSIKLITIKDILDENKDAELFITKVDIEGFEEDLFNDNHEWISQCFVLIIELHDWMMPKSANSNNFLKAISNYKRDFIYKEENIFSINNE